MAGSPFPSIAFLWPALLAASVSDAASAMASEFVTDWRSAAPEARFYSIDTYLADLNVAVDAVGDKIDLIGLCQGGWMALAFAARFPNKVRRLVLAGAPVDIAAGPSVLSRLTDNLPMATFREIVQTGEGRVLGRRVLGLWGPAHPGADAIAEILQVTPERLAAREHRLQARFEEWHAFTVDLPGTYYLQVVEWLYKQNRLATGRFVALGRRLDLSALCAPIYLIAARADELVAPAQVFATARCVGTPPELVRTTTAPSRHLGLFMGAATLQTMWPEIGRWLDEET
jgi:poly(3-hydroxyalkanoate) synthetase